MERISLTPDVRHESIWQTSIASSWSSCLNTIYEMSAGHIPQSAQWCNERRGKWAYSVVSVFTGSDTDAIWLERFTDVGVSDDIIWGSRFLNEPRLDGLENLHVLDSLRDVPNLCSGLALCTVSRACSEGKGRRTVGIDHEDTACGSGVLACDRSWINGFTVLRDVVGVVDDTADQETSSEIVLRVRSDLELMWCQQGVLEPYRGSVDPKAYLEVVEALGERLLGQSLDLFVRVSCSDQHPFLLPIADRENKPSHPTLVVYAGYPLVLTSSSRAFLPASFSLSILSASSLVMASVMYLHDIALTYLCPVSMRFLVAGLGMKMGRLTPPG